MTRTFVDAGVLILAARGEADAAEIALSVLDDPEREFAASPFLRLEVLPKSVYNRKSSEAAFYRAYFDAVALWPTDLVSLVSRAEALAEEFGLSAMDGLHAASALELGAEEFITTEQPTKPLYRVRDLTVTWLFDPSLQANLTEP